MCQFVNNQPTDLSKSAAAVLSPAASPWSCDQSVSAVVCEQRRSRITPGRSGDIHVDQQDRSAAPIGPPTTPGSLLSQTQLQAIDFLDRCIRDLEPLAALAGGAGSGKTVALNAFLARRENTARRIIRVNNFVAGPLSLHRVLAYSLGVMDAGDLSAEALEPVLRRALVDAGRSEPPVLAVDDAQSLLPETLRYLCLLAGLREAERPLLRIVLVGRPSFAIRQSMPRQFTLEALTPDDARRLVLQRFEAAGAAAPDEAVEDIVRNGQGNLRKLDALLTAGIEAGRPKGRRRTTTRHGQMRAEVRARPARRSASRWLVVPALLVAGAAALAVAYNDGMFGGHDGKPVIAAVTTPPPATVVLQPPQPPVVAPPTIHPPSAAPAKVASAPPPPPAVANPMPVPVTPAPDAPTGVEAAPVQMAPVRTVPPQAAPVQTQAAEGTPSPVVPPVSGTTATRFRVYNISACHRGVCPRWSVTDLDQGQHFVASFDPASLHLDRDMLQRVREGSLDLVVSGSIARNGSDERTLNADSLQEVTPHHGRPHPPSSSGSDPIELAPPQLQSPPPGFLPVPPLAQ